MQLHTCESSASRSFSPRAPIAGALAGGLRFSFPGVLGLGSACNTRTHTHTSHAFKRRRLGRTSSRLCSLPCLRLCRRMRGGAAKRNLLQHVFATRVRTAPVRRSAARFDRGWLAARSAAGISPRCRSRGETASTAMAVAAAAAAPAFSALVRSAMSSRCSAASRAALRLASA